MSDGWIDAPHTRCWILGFDPLLMWTRGLQTLPQGLLCSNTAQVKSQSDVTHWSSSLRSSVIILNFDMSCQMAFHQHYSLKTVSTYMLFSLMMLPASLEPPNADNLVIWTRESSVVQSGESISRSSTTHLIKSGLFHKMSTIRQTNTMKISTPKNEPAMTPAKKWGLD